MGSSDRFAKWASRSAAPLVLPAAPPAASAPPATIVVPGTVPAGMVPLTAPLAPQNIAPRPAMGTHLIAVHRPQVMAHPEQVPPPARAPTRPTCVLVKPAESDRYAELLSQLPDLVPDISGGVDAMQMSGVPPLAVMDRWTPNARYYNGVTDRTSAGGLDQHITSRHHDNIGAVRGSGCAVTRGKNHID